MKNYTTISQVSHELSLFQQAIDSRDWTLTYQYLTMLYDNDVCFDDKNFVFSITDSVENDGWGIDALDFLTVAMNDKPRFIIFKILERDDVWEVIDNMEKAIMEQGKANGL